MIGSAIGENFILTAIVMLVGVFFIKQPFGRVSFSVTFSLAFLLNLLLELSGGPDMRPAVPTYSLVGLLAILIDVAFFHGLIATGYGAKRLLRKKG